MSLWPARFWTTCIGKAFAQLVMQEYLISCNVQLSMPAFLRKLLKRWLRLLMDTRNSLHCPACWNRWMYSHRHWGTNTYGHLSSEIACKSAISCIVFKKWFLSWRWQLENIWFTLFICPKSCNIFHFFNLLCHFLPKNPFQFHQSTGHRVRQSGPIQDNQTGSFHSIPKQWSRS